MADKINNLTIPVQDALKAFLEDQRLRYNSPCTVRYYRVELIPFARSFQLASLSDCSPAILREYLTRVGEIRNPGGVHATFRAIRAFLNWVWLEYDIPTRNPITRVAPPKVSRQPLPGIQPDTINSLLKACNGSNCERDTAIILMLFDTGLRAAELCSLYWRDLDVDSGTVRVVHGKGDKYRISFIGVKTRRALRRYRLSVDCDPDAPVWANRRSTEPIGVSGLRGIMRRRAREAGIPAPGLHDFRRAALLGMLRNGMDVATVSRIAGHSDIQITMRYLALLPDDLQRAHALASPVDNAGL